MEFHKPSLPVSSSSSSSSSSFLTKICPMELRQHFMMEDRGISFDSLTSGWLRFINRDWKDVETRFDRLASSGDGIEPAVKWSGFGYCIEGWNNHQNLLMAIRGERRVGRIDNITKAELYSYWNRLTDPCFNSRLKIFFAMCDRNTEGRIDEVDLRKAILLSASANRLHLTREQSQEYAALIFEVVDTQKRGFLEVAQLASLLKSSIPYADDENMNIKINYKDQQGEEEPIMSKSEVLFRSNWRGGWIVLLWLMGCVSLFTWKFVQYRHRSGFEVMGYCLCTAKGAAETLKLNMALILLPVCRNTLTFLRNTRSISSVVAFNHNINFHKIIAGGIVIGVIIHGGTHLACDFPRISGSEWSIFRQTIGGAFGYHQPSYVEILATTEGATGIAMVLLMAIAFVLATKWPRRQSPSLPKSLTKMTGYNSFWYSHHLFILVYVLLIVHSMFLFLAHNFTQKTTWMYVVFPVMLYAGERFLRALRSGVYDAHVFKASIYRGKVLSLKLHKPEAFKHKSGTYIFIQCPHISSFQWHPFSLTSAPQDDHLSVHIRALGDWSYQIYALYQEAILSGMKNCPKIYIDGPYGAPSQDHVKYDIIMLIGLGIGVTPFISILQDIANSRQSQHSDECSIQIRGPLKAYFYWVTREQSSFDWFRDIIKEISKSNKMMSVIEMNNFLTSIHQEGDARSALISAIQALHYSKNGFDVISGTQVRTQFGRPNWFNIFSKLATRHTSGRIGVFYCGPSALARELEGLCTKFSTKTATRFVFHKENY